MTSWIQSFLGKRLLKTGIAVFLTALICQWLDWPVVFAVIAAIVTVEPTVHASIQKGKIRLPAAAIGAAIAMSFDFLFGNVPLTFALSAFFTIYICHKLRWDDAILVATLTAIAMIPMTSESFFIAFLIRIATTSIGIVVSTLVNLIIWPPNFMKEITADCHKLFTETIELIEDTLQYQLTKDRNRQVLKIRFERLSKGIERTNETIRLQREDLRYRKRNVANAKTLYDLELQIDLLHKVSFHIGDILSVSEQQSMPKEDKAILQKAWLHIKEAYEKRIMDHHIESNVRSLLYSLIYDHRDKEEILSKSTTVAYEILAIYHLLVEYEGRRERQN
ncbi:aromatic acid exporter family protein [Alkalihalobacterium alkalinitrilicum]|uniref:aromatic acid exporter family protein n=1 Tax=Alkalihalobacterium alkalinitrilicum TaxID=427920 RepID=UPI000994F66F|nr:aromatic acid exporter family protein [Alkalihalobacterium alkalinitrilicum]